MVDMATRAREAALSVECKKDALRQNQDGTWKLTLTVAPDGLPDAILKAAPGTRYQSVFVEVGDNEEPVNRSERPRERFHEKPYSVQAGMRCLDPRFQEFIVECYGQAGRPVMDALGAAHFVRQHCSVDSRKELDNERMVLSREQWEALNAKFERWAGLVPEAR